MSEDPDSELLMAKVTCSQLPLPARPRYGLVVVAKEDFKQRTTEVMWEATTTCGRMWQQEQELIMLSGSGWCTRISGCFRFSEAKFKAVDIQSGAVGMPAQERFRAWQLMIDYLDSLAC